MWPTYRGFDTFFGLIGDVRPQIPLPRERSLTRHRAQAFDYTTHYACVTYDTVCEVIQDLHLGEANAKGYDGNYSTWLFGNYTQVRDSG